MLLLEQPIKSKSTSHSSAYNQSFSYLQEHRLKSKCLNSLTESTTSCALLSRLKTFFSFPLTLCSLVILNFAVLRIFYLPLFSLKQSSRTSSLLPSLSFLSQSSSSGNGSKILILKKHLA